MVQRGYGWDPRRTIRQEIMAAQMEDNFVRAFHFDKNGKEWRFYDQELDGAGYSPNSGGLYFFEYGKCYWILVTQPVEGVVMGYQQRNLTCTHDGNCWNRIIW